MKYVIGIKPLSVNRAWQGKRFKSPAYKSYEKYVALLLPASIDVPEGALEVVYEFGVSNMGSDVDNPVKPIQDILQKRYGFNDSRIIKITATKTKVAKGQEYVSFDIKPLADAA